MALDALVAEWFISLTFLSFLLPHCLLLRAPVQHAPTKMQGFRVFLLWWCWVLGWCFVGLLLLL